MKDYSRRLLTIFAVVVLFVAVVAAIRPSSAVPSNPTGFIIPLYTYPTDGTWLAVLNAKNAHPSVPIAVVINPSNGPGAVSDSNYIQWIKAFQGAGILVLGYVATGYGSNLLTTVKSQVLTYRNWYSVNGIMFDEMGNALGQELYYSALNDYAKLLGMTFTMGNPGVAVPLSFIGTLDALDIYENPGYPPITALSQYAAYSKTDFSMIAYSVPLDLAFIRAAIGYVSWLWLTNDSLPNPYDSLPSYFSSEVAALDVSVPVVSTTTVTQTATVTTSVTTTATTTTSMTTTVSVTLAPSTAPQPFTIKAVNQFGAAMSGFWVILYDQFNDTVRTGFTPSTWSLDPGVYMVQADSYGTCIVNHWVDGGHALAARSKLHAFSVASAALTLTVVLNC